MYSNADVFPHFIYTYMDYGWHAPGAWLYLRDSRAVIVRASPKGWPRSVITSTFWECTYSWLTLPSMSAASTS